MLQNTETQRREPGEIQYAGATIKTYKEKFKLNKKTTTT